LGGQIESFKNRGGGAELQLAIESSKAAQRWHSHLVNGQVIYGTKFL